MSSGLGYDLFLMMLTFVDIVLGMILEGGEELVLDRSKLPWWKRPVDVILSSLALLVFSPLMCFIALAVKLSSSGGVLFVQERPGLHKRPFKLYKFRTMYLNGDEILNDYISKHPDARREWEVYRKLKGRDPRVTPVGRILRRLSLDELPQLVNVLKGDMSIVGPRPYLYSEIEKFNVPDEIFTVKPGLTGLWQVSGRNELPFEERIKLDLEYVKRLSWGLDVKIMLKTIWVVITGKGAY